MGKIGQLTAGVALTAASFGMMSGEALAHNGGEGRCDDNDRTEQIAEYGRMAMTGGYEHGDDDCETTITVDYHDGEDSDDHDSTSTTVDNEDNYTTTTEKKHEDDDKYTSTTEEDDDEDEYTSTTEDEDENEYGTSTTICYPTTTDEATTTTEAATTTTIEDTTTTEEATTTTVVEVLPPTTVDTSTTTPENNGNLPKAGLGIWNLLGFAAIMTGIGSAAYYPVRRSKRR